MKNITSNITTKMNRCKLLNLLCGSNVSRENVFSDSRKESKAEISVPAEGKTYDVAGNFDSSLCGLSIGNEIFNPFSNQEAEVARLFKESGAPEFTKSHNALPGNELFVNMLSRPDLFPELGQLARLLGATGEKDEKRKVAQTLVYRSYLSAKENNSFDWTTIGEASFNINNIGTATLIQDSKADDGWILKLKHSGKQPQQPVIKEIQETYTPEKYLIDRGFQVIDKGVIPPNLMLELASQVCDFCANTTGADFFRYLRKRISVNGASSFFSYNYPADITQEDKTALFSILHKFK